MPAAGPVMNVPCSTTVMPASGLITGPSSWRGRAEAGRNLALVFHLPRRLVRQGEANRLADLLVEVGDEAGGAGQDRHALERLDRKARAQQHRRNRARDVE